MPDYINQLNEVPTCHYQSTKATSVMQEPEIRSKYQWKMTEKPENYESSRGVIGIFEKPQPGIDLIMDIIKDLRNQCDDQRKIKENLRSEMQV